MPLEAALKIYTSGGRFEGHEGQTKWPPSGSVSVAAIATPVVVVSTRVSTTVVSARVASGTAAGVAAGASWTAGSWVTSGSTGSAADVHVGDLGPVAVLVGLVLDHLPAAVGKHHVVDSPGVVAVAGLLVPEVVAGGRVVNGVLELVLGRFLKE